MNFSEKTRVILVMKTKEKRRNRYKNKKEESAFTDRKTRPETHTHPHTHTHPTTPAVLSCHLLWITPFAPLLQALLLVGGLSPNTKRIQWISATTGSWSLIFVSSDNHVWFLSFCGVISLLLWCNFLASRVCLIPCGLSNCMVVWHIKYVGEQSEGATNLLLTPQLTRY